MSLYSDRSLLGVHKCHAWFLLQGSETLLQETASAVHSSHKFAVVSTKHAIHPSLSAFLLLLQCVSEPCTHLWLCLQEELFLSDECIDTRLSNVIEPVTVTLLPQSVKEQPPTNLKTDEYFYRFHYVHSTACFTSVENDDLPGDPQECPGCDLREKRIKFYRAEPDGPMTTRKIDNKARI